MANLYGLDTSIVVLLLTLVLYYFCDKIIFKQLSKLAKKTKSNIDDYILWAAKKPVKYAVLFLGLSLAIEVSPYGEISIVTLYAILFLKCCVIICVIWFGFNLVDNKKRIIHSIFQNKGIEHEKAIANIISSVIRIILVVFGIAWICGVLGFDISAFLASLSIGAAALAFAAKELFTNVFGSIVILSEEPFKEGDWIVSQNFDGVVDEITFRCVRIKKFDGEVVLIPSSMIVNSPLINRSQMEKRRIQLSYKLASNTDEGTLVRVQERIRQYLSTNKDVIQEENDIRIYLAALSAVSFEMQVICYTNIVEYAKQKEYLALIGKINKDIAVIFKAENITPMSDEYLLGNLFSKTNNFE